MDMTALLSVHVEAFWKITPQSLRDENISVKLPPSKKTVKWPSDDQLEKWVWKAPLTTISEILKVSDTAIRKRCMKKGIELPPFGHWQKEAAQRNHTLKN